MLIKRPPHTLSCCNHSLKLGQKTLIMGVLNVTPDSFSDGGQFLDPSKATDHALALIEEGADIIDIGGESSRPAGPYGQGASAVSLDDELQRTIPVIKKISEQASIPISIDTTKAQVARQAIDNGATIVNDISALRFDPHMAHVVAQTGAAIVLMHMKGTPKTMQQAPNYDDVVAEICEFLQLQTNMAQSSGITTNQIAIDPGLGFGKKYGHNIELLARLHEFHALGYPILMGPSRKQFTAPKAPSHNRLSGTLAAITLSAAAGAHIVRVHDVAETTQALALTDQVCQHQLG